MDILFFLVPLLPFTLIVLALRSSVRAGVDPVEAHKARLAALDLDEERGLLSAEEAGNARTEIKRRLLKAARTSDGLALKDKGRLDQTYLWSAFVVVIAVGVAAYRLTGAPDLPPAHGVVLSKLDEPLEPGNQTTFRDAIAAIEAHLLTNPEDAQGWDMLARTAISVGELSTAAKAFATLGDLGPDPIGAHIMQIRTMMLMTQQQITPAVGLVLEKIRTKDPSHPSLDYYRGLTALQAGDERQAEGIWAALVDRSAPDAWYVPQLKAQLAQMQGDQIQGDSGPKGLSGLPQLDQETISAAQDMTPQEQRQMIEGMLGRLDQRLRENPQDAAGWERLARAWIKLNDLNAAKDVIKRAKTALPEAEHDIFNQLLEKISQQPELETQ